jgi:hypothetical protein
VTGEAFLVIGVLFEKQIVIFTLVSFSLNECLQPIHPLNSSPIRKKIRCLQLIPPAMNSDDASTHYDALLSDISKHILQSRYRAARLVNRELLEVLNEDERVFDHRAIQNIKDFILKEGKGFAFIGNQYRLVVDEQEFFVDLLFFNRHLQCLVAIELKRGAFKPEYLGQLSFHVNVLNGQVRLPHENPSIGILLCKEKSNAVVEYAFQGYTTPMGVATYQLSSDLPEHLRNVLPDPEALKKFLG